MADSIRA
jgi:hypothetical protein